MPTNDQNRTVEDRAELDSLPSFDLSFTVDDHENPRVATVHSDRENKISTAWISINIEYAIDLEDIA